MGLLPVTVAAHYDPSLKGLVEPVAAFAPAFWSHGYANEASDRMLRRLGFVFVRECDGPYYRSRVYRLERARWDSGHAG